MNSHAAHPLRLGLTGGIGSGKSTVSAFLAEAGAALIDADALSRASTSTLGEAIAPISEQFGADYLDADGALDRARMRALVFAEPAARAQLESIVHPIVLRGIAERAAAAQAAGARLLVLDIPLLVESGRWARELDCVLVVDCPQETQIERVVRRSGMARAEVQSVIDSQASRARRRSAADIVLHNDGLTLDALRAQTEALARAFGL